MALLAGEAGGHEHAHEIQGEGGSNIPTSGPVPAGDPGAAPESLTGTVARLSGSIVVGLSAGLVLQLWTIAFLGRLGREALYVRSVFTPVGAWPTPAAT